jgi:hypothetical protein
MRIARTVAAILDQHVTLELESMDRLYLNVYIPQLQRELGVVSFFRFHRGQPFASSALREPISTAFVAAIGRFVKERAIPVVTFQKGQRKDDVAAAYLARFAGEEGVLFVGKAQEKTPVFRTEKRRHPATGKTDPWLVRATAMVNQYYFSGVDADFGPFFLKFGSYFPYTAKLCLNGHEYLKRQLAKAGIGYTALDNGLLACDDPQRAQASCDGLGAAHLDALLRKWLRLLPHPFTPEDRQAGYRYELSILQAEFALTQVLDRPLTGRVFFEAVIRENLDVGRPDQVQLIFGRRVTKRPPGALPDTGHHRGGDARAACGLQALPDQAVPQGRPRPAHRDDDQQSAGLWHWQAAHQPARAAGARLCGQPTSARRPPGEPRLCHRRSHAAPGHHAGDGRWATRRPAARCRPAGAGAAECRGAVLSAAPGVRQSRAAGAARAPAGPRSQRHSPRPDEL